MFSFRRKFSVFFTALFLLSVFYAISEEPEVEDSLQSSEIETPSFFTFKNFNAIVFLKDILDDKYPFRIDFGAEPHRHGSMVFGSLCYDWNSVFASSLRGEYDHYITSENNGANVSTTEVHSINLIPFPIVLFFGNSDLRAKSLFTEIDVGVFIQGSRTSYDIGAYTEYDSDDYGGSGILFSRLNSDSTYGMIGPAFNISFKVPIVKYISLTTESFFVPAYFLYYDSNYLLTNYILDEVYPYDFSTNGFDLSSPYLKQTIALDFFRYIRLKAQITYQHINMRQGNFIDNLDVRYSSHTLTVRYGGELLHPPKTRKKSSHMWGGLYYELSWEKVYSGSTTTNESSGKWILCFGT